VRTPNTLSCGGTVLSTFSYFTVAVLMNKVKKMSLGEEGGFLFLILNYFKVCSCKIPVQLRKHFPTTKFQKRDYN
jgi:hypothetical protein